jgi:hypothetical protein
MLSWRGAGGMIGGGLLVISILQNDVGLVLEASSKTVLNE